MVTMGRMSSRYLVYGLTDPLRSNLIFYVGQSRNGLRRPRVHGVPSVLARDPNAGKRAVIAGLAANGQRYGIEVLEELDDGAMLDDVEVAWIAWGRSVGWPLVNVSEGGNGGNVPSAAGRERMRSSRLGVPRSEATKAKIREACNRPEALARMSAANKGLKRSVESRAKMSASRQGKKPTAEVRAKMSAAHTGRVFSAETRAKISAAKRGKPRPDVAERNRTDEQKAAVATATRGRVRPDLAERNRLVKPALGRARTDEERERISEGQRRAWETGRRGGRDTSEH